MRTDAELMVEIAAGSEAAFRELIQKYQSKLKSYCATMLSCKEDVDEVIHDAFVRFWVHYAKKKHSIDSVKSLLYKIVRNAALDRCKADRMLYSGGFLNLKLIERKTPVDEIDEKRLERRLKEAIEDISPKDREILDLYYSEGMKMDEIADLLSLNPETVSSRLRRAREQVRRRLPSRFFEDWGLANEIRF